MSQFEVLKTDLSQLLPIKERFSAYKFSTSKVGDDVLEFPKEDIVPVLRYLRETGRFDILMDLCGVDYPERAKRFDVVYHLFSTKTMQRLRIKCQVGEGEKADHLRRGCAAASHLSCLDKGAKAAGVRARGRGTAVLQVFHRRTRGACHASG